MSGKKHLIIGAGSAGLAAAEEIRMHSREDSIRLVTEEDFLPYSPTLLPYLLAGRTTEEKLPMRTKAFFEKIGASLGAGKKVVRVHSKAKEVAYQDGSREGFDALLIASGAHAIRPPIPGLTKDFIGFHTLDDCRRLMRQLPGKNHIAVLGAGLVGMEVAIGLVERGCKVTVVEREPQLLPLYFDPPAQCIIAGVFEDHGVRLLTGKSVGGVKRTGTGFEISFAEGDTLTADLVVTCTGVRARVDLLKDSGILAERGILVDRRMQTNVPGIYAAGDVAEAANFFTGRPGMNQIIDTAVDEGRIAGSNMAGEPVEYEGWVSSNILNFFGNSAFSAGEAIVTGEHETMVEVDTSRKAYKKMVFEGNRLVGVMFVNTEVDPGLMLYIMRKKLDLAEHKSLLFQQPREMSRRLMLETERKESAPIQG